MEMYKYIEPTRAHEGQMVEVSSSIGSWVQRKLLTILPPPQIKRFICESLDNGAPNPQSYCSWTSARILVPKTYKELHDESGLKVGDWVKVLRKAEHKEGGWNNFWSDAMDNWVGACGKITHDAGTLGLCLTEGHWFPCFVLEKIEKPDSVPCSTIKPEAKEEYVPYTWEDRHQLRGKWYRWKSNKCEIPVGKMSQDSKSGALLVDYIDAQCLFNNATHLDENGNDTGIPFGKKVVR